MKKGIFLALTLALSMVLGGCAGSGDAHFKEITGKSYPFGIDVAALRKDPNVQLEKPQAGDPVAKIETSKGTIMLRLFPQYAPIAVERFMTCAAAGKYDGLLFDKVAADFMIQAGAPLGTEQGAEENWGSGFGLEITPDLHHLRGALAMSHPSIGEMAADANGSQFYIVQRGSGNLGDWQYYLETWRDNPDEPVAQAEDGAVYTPKDFMSSEVIKSYLDSGGAPHLDFVYTVFGQVYEGLDIVDKIANVKTGENGKPETDVLIQKITLGVYE